MLYKNEAYEPPNKKNVKELQAKIPVEVAGIYTVFILPANTIQRVKIVLPVLKKCLVY